MEKSVKKQVLKHLLENNGTKYNMHKASEEFQELALVLNQKILKPTKVKDQEIIDEIGDCILRLKILKEMFDKKLIKERVDYKLGKYKEYIDTKAYSKI